MDYFYAKNGVCLCTLASVAHHSVPHVAWRRLLRVGVPVVSATRSHGSAAPTALIVAAAVATATHSASGASHGATAATATPTAASVPAPKIQNNVRLVTKYSQSQFCFEKFKVDIPIASLVHLHTQPDSVNM